MHVGERVQTVLTKLNSGRDAFEQIFTQRRVLEHRFTHQQLTVTYFVDSSTFDSVDEAARWRVMEYDDVPEKIVRLIKAFYHPPYIGIGLHIWGTNGPFRNKNFLRQGCFLSQ